MVKPLDRKLRRRNYLIHDSHLLAVFPSEMALFEVDEEGTKACAPNEGAAGKNQGDETERPATERASGRAVALNEGRKPSWWLFAFAHSDAFSLCTLPGNHNLSRFSTSHFLMAAGSILG